LTVNFTVQGIDVGLSVPNVTILVSPGGSASATFYATAVFGTNSVQVKVSTPAVQWLSVNPSTANTGQNITVTANAAGYSPGMYPTSIVVTPQTQSPNLPPTLTVTMQVNSPPVLTGQPSALTLTAAAGATTATGQLQILTNSDPVPFTATASQPWLSVTPSPALATTNLTVTADLTRMNPASPSASITITPTTSGVQPITVQVNVQKAPPVLTAQPSALTLTAAVGATTATGQLQILTNSDPVPFTVTASQPWLSVTPSSAQATANLTVTADLTRMNPASPSASITITPTTSGIQAITVQVNVQKPVPVLTAQPSALTLTAAAGATTAAGQLQILTNSDAVPFTVTVSQPWLAVTPSSAQATANLTVTADLTRMNPASPSVSITITPTTSGVQPITVQVNVATSVSPPAIATNGVVNGASFQPGIQSGSWVTIEGTNLTPAVNCDAANNPKPGCRTWGPDDFKNGTPTSLDNVQVAMGGKLAFVYYITPTQINVQAPDLPTGQIQVTVTNTNGTSSPVNATVQSAVPAFFLFQGKYAVATHADNSLVAPAGACGGCTPAKANETIVLWGTGFGPVSPSVPAGQTPSQAVGNNICYAANPVITIAGVPAAVSSAVLNPQALGLYQVAITIPPGLPAGDQPIVASLGAQSSPDKDVFIRLQ
jgi:uncharacterized protein (TIGR03437 family)